MDCSSTGSSVHGILQARILEWVAIPTISYSRGPSQFPSPRYMCEVKVKVKSLSHVRLLAIPWTAAYQAPRPWRFPGRSSGVDHQCLLRVKQLDPNKLKQTTKKELTFILVGLLDPSEFINGKN